MNNDRFKFRVWYKEDKKFNNNICAYYQFLSDSYDCGHTVNLENYIIMQCTGLKDKNDKLIYEGDIVRFNKTGIVEWDIYEWMLTTLDGTDWIESFGCINEYEIIGNKYENPELLEG